MSRPWRPFVFCRGGRSRRVASIEAAHALVTEQWPGAIRHGSVGAWHWQAGGAIVAEAMAANCGGDWFLRMQEGC